MKGENSKEKIKSLSFIKRLILIAVVITMLAGDFILPVKLWSIAKEYEKLEQSITTSEDETLNSNEKNNKNSEESSISNNAKDSKVDVEGAKVDTEDSKIDTKVDDNKTAEENKVDNKAIDGSNSNEKGNVDATLNEANSQKANEEETSNKEDCKSTKTEEGDLSKESGENQAVEAEANKESSNIGSENITDNETLEEPKKALRSLPVNLLNTNNSLSLPQTLNNTGASTERTPEELDKEIKATTKETIEERKQNNTYKEENNLYEIRKFETQFLSGAKKDENGNLVWVANSSASGHEFTFRVNYELSGYKEIPAGCLKITIPKQILRNREGNLDDNYEMSLPTLKECKEEEKMAELIYKEDGDYLVIYNPEPVDSGLNGYFEISYATNSESYNYKDYNPSNTNTVKNGGTASDEFYAIIELNVEKSADNSGNNGNSGSEGTNTEKDILNNVAERKNVFINTNVELQSTQKRYPTIFRDWNSSWTVQEPIDKDDYYYLVWEISSYIGDSTQKYNFTLDDFVTNLTEGTHQEDYEIVGYKLAGERYYSNNNTQTNQTLSGYRYDYVLTRHKRNTFGGRTYKLKNTVTAKVHPIDGVDRDTTATSSNTFSWDPAFVPPTGHFNNFKYGNNTGFGGKYANYDLDKLQSGEVSYLRNFKYQTRTVGYAYPWTIRDGGDSKVPADYGVNSVNYETWDNTLYLEEDENPMNTNDYYLEYFTYSISNQDAEFDDFYNRFNQVSPVYADDELITFYAKFGDRELEAGNQWVQIGTYNLKTGEINITNENVESMTADRVTFKEGAHATAWKFETTNKHYYTNITVNPYFVLTNSNYVMENIQDKSSIKIKNVVSTKITDHNENVIFEKDEWAFDYARVTYYDSDISKTVSSVSNKKARKQYTITWKINVWETATSGEGIAEYIEQENGTFYDIVPLGGDIDVKSIQVQTEKGFLPENEYSYEVVTNYKNSGRTMLVLKVDEQADYYNVYYTTVHSWESMKDYGRNVLNPVAFETGNEKITKGSPDDGGNLSADNKQLFNNLDNTTNDKKFLYTERTYNINALTAAISGLQHKVKSSKDEDYKYDTEVEPGENYTYRLRFENTNMNSAKNLVFFDSIENFKVVDEESEKTSGWHGTLKGIDLNQLKQKGIDAKVYISAQENLDLEENHDLSNSAVWQMLTDETDLNTVKAIAIDITKKTNGEDFVLASGESVSAILYMQAPENSTQEMEQNQYAYGNVYMQNTLIDELENKVDYFIHQDYTSIKYHVVADIPMQKVNAQNTEEGIKGITFRLYGTSFYGNNVDEYITSGNNGYITFKSIEAGNYILQEYSGNKDWVEDHTEHQVEIKMDKTVLVDGNVITKENVLKIANTPRAHTDVIVYKKDLVNKTKPVEGVKLKLYGTSDYGNEILMYSVSDSQGKVFFEDIEKGKYKLEEVSTADGYTLNEFNKETFRVIVDENSNYNIEKLVDETNETYETTYVNGRYEVYNEPLHGFTFMKKDLIDVNKGIEGVTFKIIGTSDYGNYFEKQVASDEEGKVTFDELEKGTYTLWETETTNDYVLNTDTYTVQIDKMGDFTITENHLDGEPEKHIANIDGKYRIYNEPKHSFYFIKKDSYNNEKLGNAKFKLYGSSNNGNIYDEEALSIEGTGIVEFTNLESGTYFLKEIESPNTDETSYVLDEEERIIEVTEDGKVTLNDELIWPLEERQDNEPYSWFNTRNKGQITITKKWVDNLTNEERQEPKIYISTVRDESAYSKVYFRTADSTHSIIDYVTSQNVTTFKRNINLTEQEVTSKPGVVRLDNNSEDSNAKYKIYAWKENGTVYWWTKADRAVLPSNLDYYFQNEADLTEINWTGIYRNGFWTGTIGNEQISQSITNMQNMFYGCTAMENLDISWFNNSGITEDTKANMQYVFGNNSNNPEGTMTSLKYITFGNNFKLFDTSILPKGNWKNQTTEEQKKNTELTGNLVAGTYEWSQPQATVQVGDIVHYSPSGTYNWNNIYASSDQTGTTALSSAEGGAYRVTEWKVLNVDEDTGKIDIVPTAPTTGTVRLQGAQGYNNAVYLLNDACSNLYSDESKGITARSINMDDIENAMREAGNESAIEAPTQPYTGTYNSSYSKYPVIYGEEKLSTVNPSGTLDLSEQTRLIERNEGTSTSSYIGAITNRTLKKPYKTCYYKDYNSFNAVLGGKGNIILPNSSSTSYWVASRCIYPGSNNCNFDVRYVSYGDLGNCLVFSSNR